MAIVRDVGFIAPGLEERTVITCSTAGQVHASTANVVSAAAAVSANGRIIDRLYDLPTHYTVAMPVATLLSTRGSTEANRQLTLGVKLQHGDSSGGGDMADYSTQFQPDDRVFFTTARTSDMAVWDASRSTGALYGASNPAYYDLRAAKKYIRMVATVTKNRVTTESSGDEGMRLGGTITFLGGNQVRDTPEYLGADSTSTST